MCRLLGIYGQVDFWKEVVIEFRKQAEVGNIPPIENLKPGHKDGWGMAAPNDDMTSMVEVIRQLGSANESPNYLDILNSIESQPHIFLCHLRKASPNVPISYPNVHPFISKGWAFIHNGTIYQAESLPRDRLFFSTSDGSDSEYFFHYLLTKIFENQENKSILEKIADAVSSLTIEFTALNSMLSNGHDLFVLRSCKMYKNHFTLYYCTLPQGIIFSSEPVETSSLNSNQWKSLTNDSIVRIHGAPPTVDEMKFVH
jgi:predicted glutamine amidotransferase